MTKKIKNFIMFYRKINKIYIETFKQQSKIFD